MMKETPPVDVVDLLPVLDNKLIPLLESLTPDEWQAQTVAKKWKVKDVVAHLLDGNIRILSMLRDGYFGEQANIQSKQDLIDFLNGLNADWVKAMKRVSPSMLILLHKVTGPSYCDYYKSLPPFGKAAFAVDWAGETESKNWMHIGREYTEKWLHQQQIRDAVGKPGLLTREFFYPFISTFMMALPYTYRDVPADAGTSIKITVDETIGGTWYLVKEETGWQLRHTITGVPAAEVMMDAETAWKLFSKSWRADDVKERVIIHGDEALGRTALSMVSVMA